MKDYLLGEKQKNKFILGYDIKKEKIIVKYANGKEKDFFYNLDKELEILSIMEDQINNYSKIKENIKNKIKNSFLWSFVSLVIVTLNIFSLITSVTNIIYWFAVVVMGFTTIINFISIKEKTSLLKDLEKSKFFLDNKDIFYKINTNSKVCENININSINKYNIKQLKMLREYIVNNKQYESDNKCKKLVLKK